MKEELVANLLSNFKEEMRKKYTSTNFSMAYDNETNLYSLFHNNNILKDDDNFKSEVGENLIKYFYLNKIFNITFLFNEDLPILLFNSNFSISNRSIIKQKMDYKYICINTDCAVQDDETFYLAA